ncbi:thiol:disulfide interchange protein DsbA/DsbL [Tahibacter amnicola]|uniref:Thiol:disulfide interchange protein n=1 Tax=Tahibacter amnicola TaxID=2976241 RepID=A0ABY6BED4_9GAMM|nr:thiol:disulfide interchange protein DsbA/DsbL [Tahibacter amnicola]UXI68204.1 thiol:disulfide interchange protein DsbA/DsbL [Tahibacter amnicola]
MFQRFALAVAGLVLAPVALAQDGPWKEGEHYSVIEPALPVSGDKIEVTEVFSYGCPACLRFAPHMKTLKSHLPPNVTVRYVPASWNTAEQWPLFQRAYFTAEALGVAEKAHDPMFDAVWKNGPLALLTPDRKPKSPPPTMEDVAKYYEQYGVKAADFLATSSSFSINTKMKQADAYIKQAQIGGTPTIIVNGKYRVEPRSAGSDEKVEAVVLYLVQKESAGR